MQILTIKLGTLERDGNPTGYVVWMKEIASNRTELKSVYNEFEKDDMEQRNALIHCLLSESQRDSDQCNAITGSYHEDQNIRMALDLREMTKDMRTKQRMLKRTKDRATDALKGLAIVDKATQELGTGAESKMLTNFSEWLNELVDRRIKRIYSGFTAYGEPLLTSKMIDDEIIPRWRNDFPILAMSMLKSICSPSRNTAMMPTDKWRKTFINFFMQMRQRNPNFGSNLVRFSGLRCISGELERLFIKCLRFLAFRVMHHEYKLSCKS